LDSSIWGKSKDQLLIESKGKCAYCETPTSIIAYGDVEHFRPKSKYWWLTYCYENYLPSCTVCNQRYKSDNFDVLNTQMAAPFLVKSTDTNASLKTLAARLTVDPIDDNAGMHLIDLEAEMLTEYPLLIHPYFEDPAYYLAYKPILANKEVVVVPTEKDYQPIVDACEKYFGINRKELMDLRFQHYCTYMTYKYLLKEPLGVNGKKMVNNRLNELIGDGSRYAGMIRYFETQPLGSLSWDFDLVVDL
jgi:hypothetical protein